MSVKSCHYIQIASKKESLNGDAIKAKIIERIRTNGDQEQLALAKLTEMLINCGSQTLEGNNSFVKRMQVNM